MEFENLSSNWKKLQEQLQKDRGDATKPESKTPEGVKRKRTEDTRTPYANGYPRPKKTIKMGQQSSQPAKSGTSDHETHSISKLDSKGTELSTGVVAVRGRVNAGLSTTAEVGKYVAIDCEMVGVGPNPDKESALARVSVVNFDGDQIYDSFVRPKEEVTDWRTHVSGVSAKNMIKARSLEEAQRDIAKLLDGKILVGHAVRNDLDALLLSHPKRDIRDTSRHPPFRKYAGGGSPKLKILAAELLGMEIQGGAHSSVEDARACMLLFRQDKDAFEKDHGKRWPSQHKAEAQQQGDGENGRQKKNKKKKKKKK